MALRWLWVALPRLSRLDVGCSTFDVRCSKTNPQTPSWPLLPGCFSLVLSLRKQRSTQDRPQVGRKNWLFFGSEEAGQRSAVIYTLIENCRLHSVEPYTYLKDVLERLPHTTNREVNQLTPLKWKQARQSALKQAA